MADLLGAHLNRIFLLLLALLALASPASAHPHIFVDAKATIVFDASGAISEIRNTWSFDSAFSAWQIQGLDTNGDGITSSEEMQELADDNMSGLSEYHFYTFAGEGDGNVDFTAAPKPRLEYTDGHSILSFGVIPTKPAKIGNRFEIAVNDPEYYVAITFADANAVTLENAPADCRVGLDPPKEMPPDLADQLYALPADVTELPPDLAAALRGVQGAIVITCGDAAAQLPATNAVDAIAQVTAPQATPFGGPPPEPGFILPRTGFLGWISQQQREFYLALTGALGQLKSNGNAFWVLGGLSFLYGIFHAAGPGHGKVVIGSYMLANERQVRRGILLSFASAMLQSLVAVVFVVIAAAVLNMTALQMDQPIAWIERLSFLLMMLLGLWLLARRLFGWGHSHAPTKRQDMHALAHAHLHADAHGRTADDPHFGHNHAPGEHHDHHHGHDHDHDDHHDHVHTAVTPDQLRGDWREQLSVVFAVGIRPCSGALVVLVFALTQGVLPAGIAAVFLMGLGTAITVGVLATVAVFAKDIARRLLGGRSAVASRLVWVVEILGALTVFSFGLAFLLASFMA